MCVPYPHVGEAASLLEVGLNFPTDYLHLISWFVLTDEQIVEWSFDNYRKTDY